MGEGCRLAALMDRGRGDRWRRQHQGHGPCYIVLHDTAPYMSNFEDLRRRLPACICMRRRRVVLLPGSRGEAVVKEKGPALGDAIFSGL